VIVVDSSALVQALLTKRSSRARLQAETLHAPFLLDSEVLSTLRGHHRAGKISLVAAEGLVDEVGRMDLSRHSAVPLARRAWDLRDDLTAYDACYVALAERLGCPLVTADARIARAPGRRCDVEVVD
jgi:predicted nucleic acid-binding protein